jgi:hypothetical protein
MSTTESSGPIAALKSPKQNKPLIVFAKAMHKALLGNATCFPNPNPPLAVFAADIATYEDAETNAAGKAKGAAKLRNAKRKKVKDDLHHLRDYVQGIVEMQANPTDAAAVIESAFMSVKKVRQRSKPELSAKNTGVSSTVALDAKAVASYASYYWEYSPDQKTWITVPETFKANTVISGLTSGQWYYFRFRARTRTGPRDYSQVVRLLVL